VQGALQWLEDNQDKSLEEIEAAQKSKEAEAEGDEDETKAEIAALESGQEARSLVCNECGKRFRNEALASYHASKTYVTGSSLAVSSGHTLTCLNI
jgi:peptidoglycan hydrolase CwlO-like protein